MSMLNSSSKKIQTSIKLESLKSDFLLKHHNFHLKLTERDHRINNHKIKIKNKK